MTPEFLKIAAHVFELEGGIADDPRDRGGYTNMGITLPFLTQYLGRQATREDIAGLTKRTALDAYYKNIWLGMRIEQFPEWARPVMFSAVCGSMVLYYRVVKRLQGLCGTPDDGQWGPASAEACARVTATEPNEVLANKLSLALGDEYMKITNADPTQHVYAAGWYRRAYELSTLANDAGNRNIHAALFHRLGMIARGVTQENALAVYREVSARYKLDATSVSVAPSVVKPVVPPLGDPVARPKPVPPKAMTLWERFFGR